MVHVYFDYGSNAKGPGIGWHVPLGAESKTRMHVIMVMQTTPSRLCMLLASTLLGATTFAVGAKHPTILAANLLLPRQLQHALRGLSTLA